MSATTPPEPPNVAGQGEVRPARHAPRSAGAMGLPAWQRAPRWQDPILMLLATWIIITPWVFGWADTTAGPVTYDAWITGGFIFFFAALLALATPSAIWLEWVNVVAAIWLFVSPWVLGFGTGPTMNPAAAASDWAVGTAVFILAIWAWRYPVSGPRALLAEPARRPS